MAHNRTAYARFWPRIGLIALLVTVGLAGAQRPLADFAPADAIVTLGMSPQQQDFGSFGRALADLDWSGLTDLFERSAALIDDRDVEEMLEMFGNLESMNHDLGQLDEVCEGLSGPVEDLLDTHFLDDALLTVSLSPFNPVPAVSAFARVGTDAAGSAAALQSALADCFADTGFEQDGVSIYLLADGSDLPLLLTSIDDVFMASTSPDVLRAAIRRAGGSSEASLSDTELWQAGARLESGGMSFSLDLAAVAEAVGNLAGFIVDDAESEIAANRLLGALRTLGGYAGRVGLSDEGIVFESLIAVNPDGGDDALARLLLCRACTVSLPFLVPAEMVGVDSQYLPVRELFAYLQSWLDDVGPAMGEDLDLKQLLRDELGFDIDVGLLDWIGNQIHTVRLEPFAPDLRTLVYNPQVAYIVPVASVEQARTGLDTIGRALGPIAGELFAARNMMGALNEMTGMPGIGSGYAVRDTSYRGVDITRIQVGFNLDLGVAFIGNNLVIGSPAAALEPLIDTFEGAPNLLSNSTYREVAAAAPSSVRALSYHDHRSSLEGMHELVSTLVQPLAALIDIGLSTMGDSSGGSSNFDGGGFADLFGLTSTPLALDGGGGVATSGELSVSDEDNYGAYADYFELLGLEAGDSVTVVVSSGSFDTYLYLIDAESERILDSDDDSPDTNRSELSFVVAPGSSYWIEVASYGGNEVGAYEFTVTVEPASGAPTMAVGTPSFAEILTALDVIPNAVAVVADHVERSEGYLQVQDNTLYMRQLIRIRW